MTFQSDGNLVVYITSNAGHAPVWAAGTTANNTWTGNPGAYLAVQDNGDLVIYDAYWNAVWAASWQSNYNWKAQQYQKELCSC
jgi:hypothetical protein